MFKKLDKIILTTRLQDKPQERRAFIEYKRL